MDSPSAATLSGDAAVPFVREQYRPELRSTGILIACCVAVVLVFVFLPATRFALPQWLNVALHTLFETLSIVVSALVFSVGWYTFGRERSSSVALVCNAFLAVAVLDFVHMLSFDGMPPFVLPSGGGKAIPTWLAARLIVACVLAAIAVLPWQRTIERGSRLWIMWLCVAFAITVSALTMGVPQVKSLFWIRGQGLTGLKVGLEYVIIALDLAAAAGFLLRMRDPQPYPVVDLFAAACIAAVSEVCFTLYAQTVDQYNVVGHIDKVMAYLLVYRALFISLVRRPYRQLESARAALEETEERYRLLFENSLDGVVLAGPAGVVQAANPAACAMFRLSEQELIRLGREALLARGGPKLRRIFHDRERTGAARGEAVLWRLDGTSFDAEVWSAAYTDKAGRDASSTVVRDISERKRAEAEILRLNASLEQRVHERTAELEAANRELQQFSHSVAHDLRAPLAAIGTFSSALERALGGAADAKARHLFERVQASVQRMESMIQGLLELAHLSRSELKQERLDISAIAQQVIAGRREAEPARQVVTEVQPDIWMDGDRRLVTIALENLIGNAWKFTAGEPQARIRITAEPADGRVACCVEDNGAGFDMAYADKLFGVFQRLHSGTEFPGHGIGLATVHRIVSRHGGRIWAESAPGEGATFCFTLAPPRSAAPDDGATEAGSRSS